MLCTKYRYKRKSQGPVTTRRTLLPVGLWCFTDLHTVVEVSVNEAMWRQMTGQMLELDLEERRALDLTVCV